MHLSLFLKGRFANPRALNRKRRLTACSCRFKKGPESRRWQRCATSARTTQRKGCLQKHCGTLPLTMRASGRCGHGVFPALSARKRQRPQGPCRHKEGQHVGIKMNLPRIPLKGACTPFWQDLSSDRRQYRPPTSQIALSAPSASDHRNGLLRRGPASALSQGKEHLQ